MGVPGGGGRGSTPLHTTPYLSDPGGMGGGGAQWSGCNVRIGPWPRLLPATFIAYTLRWSLPVLSGPPMCSGLFSLPEWLGLRLRGLYTVWGEGLAQGLCI